MTQNLEAVLVILLTIGALLIIWLILWLLCSAIDGVADFVKELADGRREREEARRTAECNVKLADLALEFMWKHVNYADLKGVDQAVFVCRSLTEIQRRFGCCPMANVPVIDTQGNPDFLRIGSKING